MLVAEPTTDTILDVVQNDPEMLVWWATEVECASALARLERDEALTTEANVVAFARLSDLKRSWHEVQPVESVRRTAKRLLRTHPLRAAGAMQLAAAVVASEGDPGSMEIVSLDERLVEAARREGLVLVDTSPSRRR